MFGAAREYDMMVH